MVGLGGYALTTMRTAARTLGWEFVAIAVEDSVRHCVDAPFVGIDHIEGLPVLDMSRALTEFPPTQTDALVTVLDITKRMAGRRRVSAQLAGWGYPLRSFVDPRALIDSEEVAGNVLLHAGSIAEQSSTIGEGAVMRPGAVLSHDARLGDYAYLAPGAVVAGWTRIGAQVFVGANAVIRDAVDVADAAIVGAGAVVLRDVGHREVIVDRAER
jgi:acetyltransferase-like isoleucine patch superfamily enzyme